MPMLLWRKLTAFRSWFGQARLTFSLEDHFMTIHTLSQTVIQGLQQQDLAAGQTGSLEVNNLDLALGSLGTLGNQRFNLTQGGTAPASRPGVLSRIGSLLSDLRFRFLPSDESARAQRANRMETLQNSRHIGNLLGSLTARAVDAKAQLTIAQKLTLLSELCLPKQGGDGGWASLKGRKSLSVYMSTMTYPDLFALRDGILGHPQARREVLKQIGPGLRAQATDVLNQVEQALNQQLAQRVSQDIVAKPLGEIAAQLSRPDGLFCEEELQRRLNSLHHGLAMVDYSGVEGRSPAAHLLDAYLQSVSDDRLMGLAYGFPFSKVAHIQDRLSKVEVDPRLDDETLQGRSVLKAEASAMLKRLADSMGREVRVRGLPQREKLEEMSEQVRMGGGGMPCYGLCVNWTVCCPRTGRTARCSRSDICWGAQTGRERPRYPMRSLDESVG